MKRGSKAKRTLFAFLLLAVFLLPRHSFASNNTLASDSTIYQYITIVGVVLLASIVFGFIISNNIRRIKALHRANEFMQRQLSNYEVVNKVFGSIFFEGSHETNELTFDENYFAILGRKPHYKNLSDFGKPTPNIYPDDITGIARFAQSLQKGAKYATAEYRFIMPNGSLLWHRIEAQTFFNLNGSPESIVGRIININTQKLEMLRLQQIASSDSLTGLLSNRPAKDAIKDYLKGEGKQGTHALYLLDLDDFHDVNYIVGHYAGDMILTLIADKLKALFSDNDIVARTGGDEFVVLQKNVGTKSDIITTAQKVLNVLNFTHDSQVQISCSLGVSSVKNGNKDLNQLYREADISMYSAKGLGKNKLVVFPHKDAVALSELDQGIIREAERFSNSAFGNILKFANGGIVKLEVNSKIRMTYASESFYRLKKSKSKNIRFLWDEFMFSIHRADREAVDCALENASKTGEMVDISFRIYNRSLKFVWYYINAVRNKFHPSELIVLVSDVNALVQSNVSLDYLLLNNFNSESEREYRVCRMRNRVFRK